MKICKLLLVILLINFIALFNSCTPSSKEAAAYNDTIVVYQTAAYKSINNFFASLDTALKTPTILDTLQLKTIKNIDTAIKVLKNLGSFYKDSTLYLAADTLFNTYKYIVENDFSQIIKLYKIPIGEYTKENQTQLENLIKHSQDSLNIVNKKFIDYQRKFAKKYHLELR